MLIKPFLVLFLFFLFFLFFLLLVVVVVVLLLLLLCGQVPALQLRESKLSPQRLRHAFLHVVVAMRGLYQRAKLVHGDLSEFNILYVGGKERPVVFIDVGKHSSPRV